MFQWYIFTLVTLEFGHQEEMYNMDSHLNAYWAGIVPKTFVDSYEGGMYYFQQVTGKKKPIFGD